MRTAKRFGVPATIVIAAALLLSGGPAVAAGTTMKKPAAHTCTDGEIPSGNYASITVKGDCEVAADAEINVVGNVDVAAGAELDAETAPSTITVGRNVTAAAGSRLFLGCQPPRLTGNTAHPCITDPDGYSTITVKGNVTATRAHTVLLNGITVKGNVTLIGGGGEIPWAIKNNTIGRNLTVNGQRPEWLGVLFNTVGGNAKIINVTVTENYPGASQKVFIVRNTVERNLICKGLGPAGVSGGFIPGSVNVVGRNAIGQCASLV